MGRACPGEGRDLLCPAAADDTYVIVAGGRRSRAALEAFGPDGEVPVVIREMTDQEALEAAIDENDVRDDASETEQADAAVRILAACRNDRVEAPRRLGWSRAKLDRRLALAALSDAVKLALDERRIKVGHAELLAAVPADKQNKALETILGSGLDVGKTRDLLMRVLDHFRTALPDEAAVGHGLDLLDGQHLARGAGSINKIETGRPDCRDGRI